MPTAPNPPPAPLLARSTGARAVPSVSALTAQRGLLKPPRARGRSAEGAAHVPALSALDLDTESGVKAYQRECLDANIEWWCDALSEHTFPTTLVQLTAADARMLVRACERHNHGHNPEPAATSDPDDAALYASLVSRLASAMAECDAGGKECFVKTSCRSAKDAAPALPGFRATYDAELRKVLTSAPAATTAAMTAPTANDRLVAMLQTGLAMLRHRTAEGAVATLVRSERVAQDMLMALDHPDRFVEHLAVRPWHDIDVDLEFRGFVCKGRLTALSQYNHLAHFPRLAGLRGAVCDAVSTFFDAHVRASLAQAGFDRCVVDFAVVLGDDGAVSGGRVWVIEVNPFLPTTDACLFD